MNKRLRIIILGLVMIILCMGVLAQGTYALYTDEVKVSNHIESGYLNVTLIRDKLTSYKLNDEGFLEEVVDDQNISFSDSSNNDKNIFGLTKNDRVVPLSSYKADMIISNCSDVAFGYYLEIKVDEKHNTELFKQLDVSVIANGKEYKLEENSLYIGSENAFLDVLAVGTEKTFSVEITFKNLDNNNDAMNSETLIDLYVHAVQKVSK